MKRSQNMHMMQISVKVRKQLNRLCHLDTLWEKCKQTNRHKKWRNIRSWIRSGYERQMKVKFCLLAQDAKVSGYATLFDIIFFFVYALNRCVVFLWYRWPEGWVLGLFLLLAAMWVTKNPQFVPGWGDFMGNKYDAHNYRYLLFIQIALP